MAERFEPFAVNEVFRISPGKRLVASDAIPGSRPFIGALDNGNGVARFVDDTNESLDHNVLGVNYNGNGMVIGFYHPYECIFSDDVKRFHIIDYDDGRDVMLYAKVALLMQKNKFGYLYKFNARRMEHTKIMLPVTDDSKPDWDYMSTSSKTIREHLLVRYRQYVESRISLLEYVDIPSLDEVDWAPVFLSDMFDLVRGREGNMAGLHAGNVPLISARNCDNGLKGFVSNPSRIVSGNIITLNNDGDGGAGLAYYQPMDMALDTHVTALVPKNDISPYAQVFLARCISGLHGFFGHGRSISNGRAKRTRVMVPVDGAGKPDHAYMEQYTKNMMLRKYQQYLSYLDKQADTCAVEYCEQ